MTLNVGIYIYEEAEILDFSGPYEVFTTACRVSEGEKEPFNVFMISQTGGCVTARAGYQVLANYSMAVHPPIDVLVVVGGVHIHEMKKQDVIHWIKETGQQAQIVASVCTGAFLLAQAGILAEQEVTTHWEDIEDLRRQFPHLTVVCGKRWVDLGDIVTSGGISAGIDMSLHLVEKLASRDLALKTAKQMEFDWNENV